LCLLAANLNMFIIKVRPQKIVVKNNLNMFIIIRIMSLLRARKWRSLRKREDRQLTEARLIS